MRKVSFLTAGYMILSVVGDAPPDFRSRYNTNNGGKISITVGDNIHALGRRAIGAANHKISIAGGVIPINRDRL